MKTEVLILAADNIASKRTTKGEQGDREPPRENKETENHQGRTRRQRTTKGEQGDMEPPRENKETWNHQGRTRRHGTTKGEQGDMEAPLWSSNRRTEMQRDQNNWNGMEHDHKRHETHSIRCKYWQSAMKAA
ncbi:hypothetical protein JOQ06_028080 [Pogonophryne albipinna]|uniref:Uncharacterized protein n=1 Tax=Pogonophryne albipinna TaxID=1090488 RepID=A0AAD6AEL7_9TELE|nr:hypothetical protein JOQ06_028080 [Pogonophryne albipinna]